jgi:hypothetical protein
MAEGWMDVHGAQPQPMHVVHVLQIYMAKPSLLLPILFAPSSQTAKPLDGKQERNSNNHRGRRSRSCPFRDRPRHQNPAIRCLQVRKRSSTDSAHSMHVTTIRSTALLQWVRELCKYVRHSFHLDNLSATHIVHERWTGSCSTVWFVHLLVHYWLDVVLDW